MDGADKIQIPPFFICPISLEIMKDPVTLSTGMTYDRESIHQWLFVYNQKTCPITHQPLTDESLTPNSTLLRLIQQWGADHLTELKMAMLKTRPPTFDPSLLPQLISEVKDPATRIKALKKVKLLIQESDNNRRCMEDAGFSPLMASLLSDINAERACTYWNGNTSMVEEVMGVLLLLKPYPDVLKRLSEDEGGRIIRSLALILQRGSYQGRIYSSLLLKSIFRVVDDKYKHDLQSGLFESMVEILKDQNSNRATMAVLSILIEVAPHGRNKLMAVEAGMVEVLVELLAESRDRKACELMLGALEILCSRAEGRSVFAAHPASIAAIAAKILMVSQVGNDLAVGILFHVCGPCAAGAVVQEMLEVGVVDRLCMVVQTECSRKTKDKAKEILGLHFRAWSKSPCFHLNVLS